MRLLLIHSDNIKYIAQKKTPVAEEEVVLEDSLDEALTVFCAVESIDEEDPKDVILQASKEVRDTAEKLGTTNVMIYPYAHLSSDLSSPKVAVEVLKGIEENCKDAGNLNVKRAPFGWYKAFTLSCKGHPLSELSRTIVPGESDKPAKKEVTHNFFVMTPKGEKKDFHEFADDTPFGKLVKKETGLGVEQGGEPLHVELMRAKELVDYEPLSDVGHHRWMPRGKLVRDLLSDYVLKLVLDYGGMPVETPVMYDLGDAAINEHAGKFGERQYRFKSGNRNMMLRFAACFGMFSIMHDMHISPNTLPMKMYELSTYSFRHEQKGECIGLKRLRAFTMPDMHSLCADMEQTLKCFEEQLLLGWKTGKDFETPLAGVFRCTEDFYKEHEEWVKKIVRMSETPMLIETLSDRVHYWIAKVDLAAIDGQGRPIENPTVQIDVESADRFDIKYYNTNNEAVHPPIIHCSPTGSIERVICALLENTATQDVPMLPVWLSPTQVRVVPVAERHIDFAEKVCLQLNNAGVRCDMDDREESVGKKVREAGMDWVPYVAVVGDSEVETGKLTVTIRRESQPKKPMKVEYTAEELEKRVKQDCEGNPFRPIYTSKKLSEKPRFI
ncbi:threonine--tRNA ligase [Methanoplanus sp. FWC-SCC4]|uniref:Threonine--tRNA ligase n=1 Tax=Methanochimaera problematica TaxID=2609417 RepID=A0AA97FBV1_9EURY|nr:threonine--tRNA ligase [Methanoplanus sp. FWC-SCC4]WOF15677.1 threonine--tRNA ligase [Methanoplanus sp. FWC-SCC4]